MASSPRTTTVNRTRRATEKTFPTTRMRGRVGSGSLVCGPSSPWHPSVRLTAVPMWTWIVLQWVPLPNAEHSRGGGCDQHFIAREHIAEDGLQLRRMAPSRGSEPKGGYVNWMVKEEKRRKQGHTLTKEEHRNRQGEGSSMACVGGRAPSSEGSENSNSKEKQTGWRWRGGTRRCCEPRQHAIRLFVDGTGKDRNRFPCCLQRHDSQRTMSFCLPIGCGRASVATSPGSRIGNLRSFVVDSGRIKKNECWGVSWLTPAFATMPLATCLRRPVHATGGCARRWFRTRSGFARARTSPSGLR